MRQTNFVYAILNTDMLDVLKLDSTAVRFNKYGTKFLYKTYKEEPLIKNTPFYTKKTIKTILSNDEWRNNLNTI